MDSTKKVVVYSTPTCPHCKRAKQFLAEIDISYQDIDVASDKEAREEMMKKTGKMAVPVIEIDGVAIVGFDEANIKKQLGI
jgi:glutaredoxin 3